MAQSRTMVFDGKPNIWVVNQAPKGGKDMDETTQHYLNSLRAIAFPNGQVFVEHKDIPLANRFIDLGLAKNRIEYADCSGNCWIWINMSARRP